MSERGREKERGGEAVKYVAGIDRARPKDLTVNKGINSVEKSTTNLDLTQDGQKT